MARSDSRASGPTRAENAPTHNGITPPNAGADQRAPSVASQHLAEQAPPARPDVYDLVESSMTLAIQAAQLLDVAVGITSTNRDSAGLDAVVRAARGHIQQVADMTSRAEVGMMRPDSEPDQAHSSTGAASTCEPNQAAAAAPDYSVASAALECAYLKAGNLARLASHLVMDAEGVSLETQDGHHALIASIQTALEETREAHEQMDSIHRQATRGGDLARQQAEVSRVYEPAQRDELYELLARIGTLAETVGDIGYHMQNYSNGYAQERESKANQLQVLDRILQEATAAALAIIDRAPATR